MSEQEQRELISAYLDGELTGDEQARVEDLLVDSPSHRQLFNQLRSMRESLQSLPTFTLDAGFADRVLKQAERRMLAPSAPDKEPLAESQSPDLRNEETSKSAPDVGHGHSRTLKSRALIPAIAVAAALLIAMFFGPWHGTPESKSTNVARHDDVSDPQRSLEDPAPRVHDEAGEAADRAPFNASQADTNRDLARAAAKQTNGLEANENQLSTSKMRRALKATDSLPAEGAPPVASFGTAGNVGGGRPMPDLVTAPGGLAGPTDNLALRATQSLASPNGKEMRQPPLAPNSAPGVLAEQPFLVVVDVPQEVMASGFVNESLSTNGIAMLSDWETTAEKDVRRANRFQSIRPSFVHDPDDAPSTDNTETDAKSVSRGHREYVAKEFENTHPAADVLVVTAGADQIEATCNRLASLGCKLSVHRNSARAPQIHGPTTNALEDRIGTPLLSANLAKGRPEAAIQAEAGNSPGELANLTDINSPAAANATAKSSAASSPRKRPDAVRPPAASQGAARPAVELDKQLQKVDKSAPDDKNRKPESRDGAADADRHSGSDSTGGGAERSKGNTSDRRHAVPHELEEVRQTRGRNSFAYRAGAAEPSSKYEGAEEAKRALAPQRNRITTSNSATTEQKQESLWRLLSRINSSATEEHPADRDELAGARRFARTSSDPDVIRVIFVFRPIPVTAEAAASKNAVNPVGSSAPAESPTSPPGRNTKDSPSDRE